jgi:hypothetical protein
MKLETYTLKEGKDNVSYIRIRDPQGKIILSMTLGEWSRMIANPHRIPGALVF